MSTPTKTPSLPAITPANLTEFARAVKGILDVREGRVGDKLDANVTFRDLVSSGIAQVAAGARSTGGTPVAPAGPVAPGGYDPTKDMTIPPKASGLAASGAFSTIMLRWDFAAYANHSYTEVWASSDDQIGGAILIGTSTMSMYVDAVGELGFGRYYWIRHVSEANQTGAFNATSGTYAETATSTESLRQVLAGQISESELSQSLGGRISLIDAPASTLGSVAHRIGLEAASRAEAINQEASARSAAILQEASNRSASISQESTARAQAISAEAAARAQAIAQEVIDRNAAISVESAARAQAISGEALTRTQAIAEEAANRAQAILDEAAARESADGALQTQINTLTAASSGDFSQLIAAVQEEQTARIAADQAEASSRQTLAAQMRGAYTGDDLAQLTTGLLYSESQARAGADSALSSRASALEATVSSPTDGNAALKARIASEESARASGDEAVSNALTTLTATVGTKNKTYRQPSGPSSGMTTGDVWYDSDDSNKAYRYNGSSWEPTDDTRISQNAAAITAEQTARASADAAISSTVTTLTATVNTKNKTYRQTSAPTSGMTTGDVWYDSDDGNKAYRYSGTGWIATDDTRIASNTASILSEQTARANADSALASQITSLSATVDGNSAAIQQETTARVNADSALQTQINTLTAASSGDFSQLIAALQEEQTARTNADSAEAAARQTLATQMRGSYTGTDVAQLTSGLLYSEAQARSSADSAISSTVTTLTATVNTKNKTYRQPSAPTSGMTAGDVWYDSDDNNKPYRYSGSAWVVTDDTRIAANSAAITAEQTARANADSALATQITSLTATVNGNTASIQQEATSRATADEALQTQINLLSAASSGDFSELLAALQEEQSARTTADSAEAAARQNLATQMRGLYQGNDITQVTSGLIYSEALARSSGDAAIAQSVSSLQATVNSNKTLADAAIASEQSARASSDDALSTSITSLTATVNTKNKTYRQASAPTSGMTSGDVWYDSDDSNKPYRYSGTAWVATEDTRIATNSAAITAEQTARANADTALASRATSLEAIVNSATDGNAALKARIASEESARASGDTAISTTVTSLTATVNAKTKTYMQPAAPTSGMTTGDIWYDSDDGNRAYRYSGTAWAQVDDTRIAANAAAITAEQTARANGDTAISNTVTTLTATVNTKNKTYRQASAPTSGMTAGDIWYDSDDSNKTYRYSGAAWVATEDTRIAANTAAITVEQTARANADSALATQINTLTASVNGNSAAIQQEATARASETGSLFAKYAVKVDLAGHVSGFGLASTANNATPTSSFLVRADQFAITPPSISSATAPTTNLYNGMVWVDTSVAPNVTRYYTGSAWTTTPQALPFVVQSTPTSVNGVAVDPGVYMPDAFFMNGSIGNAKIGNAAIDDAKIASLSAAKLTAGDGTIGGILKSENYVPGQTGWAVFKSGDAEFSDVVVRGTVYATDGVFNGEVISVAPSGNKARMWSGNFEIYKNVPGVGVTLYKALSRVETGVGANNVKVTIPGYFTSQPKVIVSPANIQLYNSTNANQSQSIQCEARNLVESPVGSMVWKFTPLATLSLAANTGQSVVNQISGTIQTNWTSSNYTTKANTESITPNITLASYRGSGTSGVYLYRTVRWRVEYLQSGAWVNGAWTTVNLGANANASAISTGTLDFPSSGTWTFRIYAEAYDTNGSTFGSTAYETIVDTVTKSGNVTVSVLRGEAVTRTLNYTPSYSVPAGWSVSSVSYTYLYSWNIWVDNGSTATIDGGGIYHFSTGSGSNITKTYNRSSNSLTFTLKNTFNTFGSAYGNASLTLHNATAKITRTRPAPASSTANNSFSFNSYVYSLSSAQELATGTLNWVAIGE